MTPPPNSNDDPFGGMDPMAWLESLAKRQGANLDELTTAADIDIPVLPSDTVIDEPGYTPYDTGSSKPKPAEPAPKPVPKTPAVAAQPAPAPATSDDPFGGMDPMAWLESLAKRQGANADELTTAADIDVPMPPADAKVSGPGYTPGYDTGKPKEPKAAEPAKPVQAAPRPVVQQPAPQPPPAPVQQPAASQPAATDDAFGGMDPMAWLESLAKRQGANVEELTTAANIDVPMPPPDAKVSGPGYTPGYDTGKPKEPKAAEPAPKQPESAGPETKPIPPLAQPRVQQPIPTPPAQQAVPQPTASQPATDEVLSSLDPLAWLESLARRQGANPDELVTGGNQELPAPPTNVVIDEPGYVDYTPFGDTPAPSEAIPTPSMSSAEAERLLGITADADANPLNDMDPLAWLESLAAPDLSGAGGFADLETPSMETSEAMEAASALSWLEELARENQSLPTAVGEDKWVDATVESVDETGGISDDLAEVQRWLNAQADSLASVHEQDDFADLAPANESAEVQPGDLPDWLRNQMPATRAPEAALRDEILEPPIPADLPSWLQDNVDSTEAISDLSLDLNEFGTPEATPVPEAEAEPEISADELAALVLPEASDAPDPWAQALDEEYERRLAGDETIPDWYMEAVVRNGDELEEAELPEPQAALPPTPDVIKAGELPDWLKAMEEPAELSESVDALPGDIPDWLLEGMPQGLSSTTPEATADLVTADAGIDASNPDNWFDQLEPAELPDWLQPAPAAEPEPIPEPVQAQPQVNAPPVTVQPIVTPPKPEPKLEPQPVSETVLANHAQRLRHARELLAQDRHSESLMHYESLIDDQAVLDDVIQDVGQLVQSQPKNPRARRLLGDAHLRKGNLQEALDTYRSALDQL